jgi:hypothetical protein
MVMLKNFGDNGLRGGPKMILLPESFSPSEHDFVCGRGRKIFMHVGNQRFRQLVGSRLQEYCSAATKLEKSCIIGEMVDHLRSHGGFVKKSLKDGRWYQLGGFLSREKTSQAIRDALADQRKSNSESKKELRSSKPHRAAVSDVNFQASLRAQLIKHPSTNNGTKAENRFGGQSISQDSLLPLFTPKKGIVSYQPSTQISSLCNSEWASQNFALLQGATDEFNRIEPEESREINPFLEDTLEAPERTSKLNQATEQAVIADGSIFERLVHLVDTIDEGDDPFEPVPCVAQGRHAAACHRRCISFEGLDLILGNGDDPFEPFPIV